MAGTGIRKRYWPLDQAAATGYLEASASDVLTLDGNDKLQAPQILCALKGTIKDARHPWEVEPLAKTMEWEPSGYLPEEMFGFAPTRKVGSIVKFGGQYFFGGNSLPYPHDSHFVRLSARLQEFETYTETITFPNTSVIRTKYGYRFAAGRCPQTIISPSGVKVILMGMSLQNNTEAHDVEDVNISLGASFTRKITSLPHSPLWQSYRRPVTVTLETSAPCQAYGSMFIGNVGDYSYLMSNPPTKQMKHFSVTIHQRVDLRTVPMTFTLPVGSKPPTKPL